MVRMVQNLKNIRVCGRIPVVYIYKLRINRLDEDNEE